MIICQIYTEKHTYPSPFQFIIELKVIKEFLQFFSMDMVIYQEDQELYYIHLNIYLLIVVEMKNFLIL